MTTTFTPRTDTTTGASLTGSDGATNRVLTLDNSPLSSGGLRVFVSNVHIQQGSSSDYTVSGQAITFLGEIFNDQNIVVYYYTTASSTTGAFYSTTLQIVRVSGVGVEIENELLGTGDSTEQSYDVNNGRIIADSYTVKFGTASGALQNSFTNLIESTDYSIDKDEGRILLTTGGTSTLGSNKLYIDYIHSPKMSDTIIESFQEAAKEEVDRKTGNFWGPPASRINYLDGRNLLKYPTTDRPYAIDRDPADRLQLDRSNITEVNKVFFLNRGIGLDAVFSYDDSTATFTDNTEEANSVAGTSFNVFATTPATSDIIYYGSQFKFGGITTELGTTGVVSSITIVWEYWNGSAWTSFTPTDQTTGAKQFTASGRFTWTALSDWQITAVNNSTAFYYVRARLSAGSYTTVPTMVHTAMDQDTVINKEIPLYNIDFTSSGEVTLTNERIPEGERNVKIEFKYGETTTNPLIAELEANLVGLRVYANITGGSYDDETGYTIGRASVSIGEVYINVREVVRQFELRISEILKAMGRRTVIGVI